MTVRKNNLSTPYLFLLQVNSGKKIFTVDIGCNIGEQIFVVHVRQIAMHFFETIAERGKRKVEGLSNFFLRLVLYTKINNFDVERIGIDQQFLKRENWNDSIIIVKINTHVSRKGFNISGSAICNLT